MVLQDDADRVKHLLAEAISVLCKNGLSFESELCVEGLLGITLDNSDIFLVNINETITTEGRKQQQTSATKSRVSAPKEKSPQSRHGKKRGYDSQPTSPEPSAKRNTRNVKSSASDRIDIKTEKLSITDDASSYGGDDAGFGLVSFEDASQDMKCTRCGKMFDNPANLERHLKEIHFVGVTWLCCQNCDFSHVSMKHFNYHMFRLHRKVGGKKRNPQELKFLTPDRIKYRIEHNMRVPDISDNRPQSAAEKSRSSASSLRRTPARLSANASRRMERPLVRIADKPRVTVKTEPKTQSGPRSLRHRDSDGQVVVFSKDRKGSLRRQSAPPAPTTPRTAKVPPKPAPKVAPKPVAPKAASKVTPKSKPTPKKEEKKSTPKRAEKKVAPKEEKKATPRRDDKKKTSISKDKKKTPVSSKKADRRSGSSKIVVKKKSVVAPKKVVAKKSPTHQKPVKRKSSAKKEKIIWPEGVSVKDFEIKLDPLNLFAVGAADREPDVETPSEKSVKSPEKVISGSPSKDDKQQSPVSSRKSEEIQEISQGDKGSTESLSRSVEQPGTEGDSGTNVSSSDSTSAVPVSQHANANLKKDKEKEKTTDAENTDKTTISQKEEVGVGTETASSLNKDQLSSEQVSSTTVEGKESDPAEEASADTTETMGNEGEQVQSLEPMETEDSTKEIQINGKEREDAEETEKDSCENTETVYEIGSPDEGVNESEEETNKRKSHEAEMESDPVDDPAEAKMETHPVTKTGSPDKGANESEEETNRRKSDEAEMESDPVDDPMEAEMETHRVAEIRSPDEGNTGHRDTNTSGSDEPGDIEMEKGYIGDVNADLEAGRVEKDPSDKTNYEADSNKEDDAVIMGFGEEAGGQTQKGSSPRAKGLPLMASADQSMPSGPDQRVHHEMIAGGTALMGPRSPVIPQPVYEEPLEHMFDGQQHTTSSQQSGHQQPDEDVDVSAILGEINTMNQ